MSASLATRDRSMQVNTLASTYRQEKPKAARIAPDCQIPASEGNLSVQMGDPTLALIDETFVFLGWKHDAVAAFIGVSAPLFSRAMRGVDGKKFDVTWFSNLPAEFWPAFNKVIAKTHNITQASRSELLLDVISGHMETLNKLMARMMVSE